METYDLNIENYELEDILSLFHLKHDFTNADLKEAHKMALQMHPDKSNLTSEYFIFFMKAYKLLCRIHYFRFRPPSKRPTYDVDLREDEKIILHNLQAQKKTKEFNRWFNEMFEKVKIKDNEQDSGYEDWFRDLSDAEEIKRISLSQFDSEFEKKKQNCKALAISTGLGEMGGDEGYGLMREQPKCYSAAIFSKLPYEDLKKAHTETVVPVTKEDFLNKPTFSNIDSYKSHRDNQNIAPPSLQQSRRFLAEKTKNDAEGDVHRIYNILKQDEEIQERNSEWWGYLKQLTNE